MTTCVFAASGRVMVPQHSAAVNIGLPLWHRVPQWLEGTRTVQGDLRRRRQDETPSRLQFSIQQDQKYALISKGCGNCASKVSCCARNQHDAGHGSSPVGKNLLTDCVQVANPHPGPRARCRSMKR